MVFLTLPVYKKISFMLKKERNVIDNLKIKKRTKKNGKFVG